LRLADGVRIAADADAVAAALQALLDDPGERARMAAAGRQLVEQGRGALRRTLDLIATAIGDARKR
jgi:3-deoxy-D-manno-octulosonic-acid transferase